MSRPLKLIQKGDVASLPEQELGALRMTFHVRKSSRSTAWQEGVGLPVGLLGRFKSQALSVKGCSKLHSFVVAIPRLQGLVACGMKLLCMKLPRLPGSR